MKSKEFSRLLLPPIAINAGKWLLKHRRAASATLVRFQYGQFFLECDVSHRLPKVLEVLPNLVVTWRMSWVHWKFRSPTSLT
jgi:hypothetical protein